MAPKRDDPVFDNGIFNGGMSDLCIASDMSGVTTISDNIGYADQIPREGEVRYHSDKGVMQVYSEAGDGWKDMAMPVSENNGYTEIERFIEKLSVSQLQDVYKRKDELLIQIEKLLLGQI